MAEVLRLTRFPCEAADITARFKILMEQGYMEVDKADEKLYHYLA